MNLKDSNFSQESTQTLLECFITIGPIIDGFGVQYGQTILEAIMNYHLIYMNNRNSKHHHKSKEIYLRTIDLLSVLVEQLKEGFNNIKNIDQFYKQFLEITLQDEDHEIK